MLRSGAPTTSITYTYKLLFKSNSPSVCTLVPLFNTSTQTFTCSCFLLTLGTSGCSMDKEAATASFQEDECVGLVIVLTDSSIGCQLHLRVLNLLIWHTCDTIT